MGQLHFMCKRSPHGIRQIIATHICMDHRLPYIKLTRTNSYTDYLNTMFCCGLLPLNELINSFCTKVDVSESVIFNISASYTVLI